MTLKKKIVLLTLAACSCLFMLCACGARPDAEEEAKREGETYAYLILNEMLPLLKSYFLGRFYCDDNFIFYKLLNGQAFKIFVIAEK